MKPGNLKRSPIMLLGLVLLALLLWRFVTPLKAASRPGKKNTTTNYGFALYSLLVRKFGNTNIAKYITAQAAHETANFSSRLFTENRNLFGMKFAGQALAENKNGFASYNSLEDSTTDFLNYYRINKYKLEYGTPDEYATALKLNGYYTAPISEYLKGMKYFLTVYFNEGAK
jgi:hypothetical protein